VPSGRAWTPYRRRHRPRLHVPFAPRTDKELHPETQNSRDDTEYGHYEDHELKNSDHLVREPEPVE
jgi:hypothetical protein